MRNGLVIGLGLVVMASILGSPVETKGRKSELTMAKPVKAKLVKARTVTGKTTKQQAGKPRVRRESTGTSLWIKPGAAAKGIKFKRAIKAVPG